MTPRRLPRFIHTMLLVLPLLGGTPMIAAAEEARVIGAAPSSASAARASLGAYLALWRPASVGAADSATSQFSEDVVLRYAHGNPEVRAEVHGRASVITQVRAMARLGTSWRFSDLRIFPTLRGDVYFAQFIAATTAAEGGPAIEKTVVMMLEHRGEKLVRIVEFANPAVALAMRLPQGAAAAP